MLYKLVEGLPFPCPESGVSNGVAISGLPVYYEENHEIAEADGYYPIVEQGEETENSYPVFELNENIIVKRWVSAVEI